MYPANQNIRDRSISLYHMLTHRLNTYQALVYRVSSSSNYEIIHGDIRISNVV